MTEQMKELLQDRVFRIFYEISQIPRQSFHEEQISAYLAQWAKERNVFVVRDACNNVLMRKAASKGMEDKPGIILQAHMDMVCEKTPESSHDFSKDGIPWEIEGDWLTTGGETTLGADDGIGMALAMAALEEEWKHPVLEVLLTTAEEEDLSGAAGFDTGLLEGKYLINLDNSREQEILCGSCGGEAAEVQLSLKGEDLKEGWEVYKLKIGGLLGGHSGGDIHMGHGNANKLLARVLLALREETEIKLVSIKGGTFRLAIAREAECVLAFPGEDAKAAERKVERVLEDIREEYLSAGEKLSFAFSPYEGNVQSVYDGEKVLDLLLFSPDGIFEMNSDMPHLVSSSDNMGEVYLEKGEAKVVYEIRAARNSARGYLAALIGRLAEQLGGICRIHSVYPSWEYRPESVLREKAIEIFQKENNGIPEVLCVHGGLECGCFFETKPELDAISIGPDCLGLHSPEERLCISSTKKIYKILGSIIQKMYQ